MVRAFCISWCEDTVHLPQAGYQEGVGMIAADKQGWFEFCFHRYNTRLLRRHFSKLHLAGIENVRSLDKSLPIIFFGNHSCWWDGLLEHFLAKEIFHLDLYLMMEEKQMVRYKFFRWAGAFSVNRDSPREAVASMRYAASLFTVPGRAVWMYPQGVMQPNDSRPLSFYQGLARITSIIGGKVQLVPFAHRYEFMMEQRPEAFTSIGRPLIVDGAIERRKLTAECESAVTRLLDELKGMITSNNLTMFSTVLTGMKSTNVKYDTARRRL
jgi:chlorobactene lauroyltransferase